MSLIKEFFSGNFHEDWKCEAETPLEIIADYMRYSSADEMELLRREILDYMNGMSDSELEERLLSDLGCYYWPPGDGVGVRSWLSDIAKLLENPVEKKK